MRDKLTNSKQHLYSNTSSNLKISINQYKTLQLDRKINKYIYKNIHIKYKNIFMSDIQAYYNII